MSLWMVFAGLGFPQPAAASDFSGWDALRVIEQEGYPFRLYAADLNGDGRDELVVVNLRNARLEFLRWRDPTHGRATGSAEATPIGEARVNELPMAPEIQRTELSLKQTPIDVAIEDLDGDGRVELYVLVADPNRLLRVVNRAEQDAESKDEADAPAWELERQWELLPGGYSGAGRLMQFVDSDDGAAEVLISTDEGIQRLEIPVDPASAVQARATWVLPREAGGRKDWWLADLDGDSRDDLVEWTGDQAQTIRWHRRGPDGFLPAQPLYDRAVVGAALLDHATQADELLILEGSPAGMVRRYRLGSGDAADAGRRDPLALPGGDQAVWTLSTVEDVPVLLTVDPQQPRISLFRFTESGWTAGPSFPVIADIKRMIALPTHAGDPRGASATVLLWPRDGSDLSRTFWEQGRFSFPQPLGLSAGAAERAILGLGRVSDLAWCVQKVGDDLVLHRWSPGGAQPESTVYAGAAGKADEAGWLGEAGLLVIDKFTRGLRHVRLNDGEVVDTRPAPLAAASLNEFRLLEGGDGALRPARFTDGVMQWLDGDLHAIDQIMLSDGLRLSDLTLLPDGDAWALQQGGTALHRMTPDAAGVLRVASTERLHDGRALWQTPELGLLLQTGHGVTRLRPGQPWELEVAQSIDARTGRPAGVSEVRVHRLSATDVNGDGRDDAVLHDDLRHQVSVYAAAPSDADRGSASTQRVNADLQALLSWPVFEDRTYPYGDGQDEQVREPRRIVALDLDGDGHQDLAMLCHDRLLIYLAREATP